LIRYSRIKELNPIGFNLGKVFFGFSDIYIGRSLIFSENFDTIYPEVNLNIILAIATHNCPRGKRIDLKTTPPKGKQNEDVWLAENNGGIHFPEPYHWTVYIGQ